MFLNHTGSAVSAASLIALSATLAGPATAQHAAAMDAEMIPREALLGNPTKSQGRISPDGEWLSWLAPRDGIMNVWVAPASDPSAARPVTDDDERGIANHSWTPDSQYILTQQDKGGNENFHIYATNVQTAETRDLTPVDDNVRAVVQAVSNERPGEILVGLNDRNPQLFDMYLVDYRTGERTLAFENPGFAEVTVDHQLTPRLGFAPTAGGGAELYAIGEDGAPASEPLVTFPSEDFLTSGAVGFNKAGTDVYMLDSRDRDKAALVTLDLDTGETSMIAEPGESDISNVLFHPTTHAPLAYEMNYLKAGWTALDESVADDLERLESQATGNLQIVSTTDDNRKWVVIDDAAEKPGTYMLYDRDNGELTEMFTTRPELADAPLQPMHPLEIESRDGLTLVSYLTLPPGSDEDGDGRPDGALPTLLWVHGGPWARDEYGYNTVHQWMANRGYAVLSVNYRGSTGFGKEHVNKAIGEWSGKMHDDLIDAVDWAIEEGIAQPDKVAIGGGSYGGYATLVGVTFTPDKFACGVDIVGPSNLVTLIESFPDYWKPVLDGTFIKHIGDPADPAEREDMTARSPLTRADQIRVPLLIGQGGNDPRVTKIESDQIVEAMQQKELPVTYINYPDEGHGFQEPANRLSFFAAMEGFLGQCLGGRVQPIDDAFEGSSAEILAGAEFVEGLESTTGGE
ncbi:hypothetical protein B5C34_15260 [Pacificimonas flava]|uniref:Peptidase S9 prolyl oligopeptidase catalytic domain-containing protein n=2 Tax=Pacificimonas TaxID=1960290 RepID=A0A219B214_9SPHN|nr:MULTISPECIES: S9 family peptidase [Pacificimonas]MBZ6379679.1 S9 family peptidase [Pacificimonas aurantium]OWV31858.1 hypothetical protein B5C34_15260 [Pacificimonas flava]